MVTREAGPLVMAEAEVRSELARLDEGLELWREELPRLLHSLSKASGLPLLTEPEALAGEVAPPPALWSFVASCLAALRELGRADLNDTVSLLYSQSMPTALAMQRAGLDPRCPGLMAIELALSDMPRLARALARLDTMLTEAHVAAGLARPRFALDPLLAGERPSLGEWYATTFFGGLQPLFGTTPEVLAALANTPAGQRTRRLDELLAPALLHELLHFDRSRAPLHPPYLDEAIAGALGVLTLEATALPSSHHRAEGEALEGFLTYAQLGLALATTVGVEPLLLAQCGSRPWAEVLPDGAQDRALSLYWRRFAVRAEAHLHPDPDDPAPFLEALVGLPGSEAVSTLCHLALRGAAMTRSTPGRVVWAPPPAMTFDFGRGLAWAMPPNPGAPATHLIGRTTGTRLERLSLPPGASAADLARALDAAGLPGASSALPGASR